MSPAVKRKKRRVPKDIPHHEQSTEWTCGPAAMRMALATIGIRRTETQLIRAMGTNRRWGTPNRSFPLTCEHLKLDYVVRRKSTLRALRDLLDEEYVVIVCYTPVDENFGHYSVVRGIGAKEISLVDPLRGPGERYTRREFLDLWKGHEEPRWMFGVKKPKNRRR